MPLKALGIYKPWCRVSGLGLIGVMSARKKAP